MGKPANPMDNHVRHNSLCAVITIEKRSWNEKNLEVVGSGNGNNFYCQSQITNSEKFVRTLESS